MKDDEYTVYCLLISLLNGFFSKLPSKTGRFPFKPICSFLYLFGKVNPIFPSNFILMINFQTLLMIRENNLSRVSTKFLISDTMIKKFYM